jgi:hypothetical protein
MLSEPNYVEEIAVDLDFKSSQVETVLSYIAE